MAPPRNNAFSRRLDQIISSLWTADYQSTVLALNELESATDVDPPEEAGSIERRRAIADVRLLAAHKKKQPIEKCDAVFSARMGMGFATIADEATTVSAHARYCQQAGETELAGAYAAAILSKIDQTRGAAQAAVPEELEAVLRGIGSGKLGAQ